MEGKSLLTSKRRKSSGKNKMEKHYVTFSENQTDDETFPAGESNLFETEFDYLFPLTEVPEMKKEEMGPPYFPYERIYEQPFDLKGPIVDMLLPGYPITVKFLSVERHVGLHIINPYLYVIQVNHANFVWIITRTFVHLKHLHKSLKKYLSTSKHLTTSLKNSDFSPQELSSSCPKFPKTSDATVPENQVEQMAKILEEYMNNLLKYNIYRNHVKTMELLQISPLSFVLAIGHKGNEGMVRIRSGGHLVGSSCIRCCRYLLRHCRLWARYWIIVRDNFLVYINPQSGRVKYVLLMDSGFIIKSGFFDTGIHFGIIISNLSRKLLVNLETRKRAIEWEEYLKELAVTGGKDFTQPNRYGSFVPVRHYTKAMWFVDGWNYFSCLADLLDSAKEEIFIASWWVTPELHLKRPPGDDQRWRLDRVLKRKAEEGVRIFILLYKEVEIALNIGSSYAKAVLSSLHPNIKVIRHPDHLRASILLWAHHEKIVIIDQSHAFIGGIDPCFGRWDDWNHQLDDLGKGDDDNEKFTLPKSQLEADFMMRKAIVEMFLGHKRKQKVLEPSSKWWNVFDGNISLTKEPAKFTTDKTSRIVQIYRKLFHKDSGLDKKWPGKDYANFIHKDISEVDKPMEDQIDRYSIPRLPWHDVSAIVVGAAARDISRHFIQRWNMVKFSKARHNDNYPWLLPKSYAHVSDIEPHPKLTEYYSVNCQICRSACDWSTGINACEQSIHTAYIDCINNSKHFVYIENQFFITHPPGDNDIYNEIWEAIYKRILTAQAENQAFKIYVVIPMLPGFEGDIKSDKSTVMRTIAYYTYTSISKGPSSLLERLSKLIPDPTEYITFFSLRNYGKLGTTYVSEMVYIHSKMVIVDDTTVIIGSANINDRSLLGRRDSEMAVVINDYEMIESTMNGERYAAGQYAISLRKRLFAEHLGLKVTDPVLDDPVSNKFFKDVLMKTAFSNTALHEKIFHCIPTNETATYSQLWEYSNESGLIVTNPPMANYLLNQIKGFLVIFPLYFLSEESMEPTGITTTTVLPSSCFT